MNSAYVEFMARLAEADLGFRIGPDAQGLDALRLALALGRKGGFVNTPVWDPRTMTDVCARALDAGIEIEYVRGLIRKRQLLPDPDTAVDTWPWPIKVFTCGTFEVQKDDQPLTFAVKVRRRPLGLLKLLIALGGHRVREDRLTDALWPDAPRGSNRGVAWRR